MPSLRGLRLALSFLTAPAGIGLGAHQLTNYYSSLMDFSSTFFLVQVTEGLFDKGIPHVPKAIDKAVDEILKQKQQALQIIQKQKAKTRSKRATEGEASAASSDIMDLEQLSAEPVSSSPAQQQVFGTGARKFWCRYFDYSGGKENVILEYDPYCSFYNILDINGNGTTQVDSKATTENQSVVINLSALQGKTNSLKGKELKSNDEFKKGGYYLLKLDKTRIPNVNSSFSIELSEPGDGTRKSERVYHKKIATVKVQAELNGDPFDDVSFNFPSQLPSAKLILKKVENGGEPASSSPSSPTSENQDVSYYFKTSSGGSEKLFVEEAWSFKSSSNGDSELSKKFDLSTLDKEPLEGFKSNGAQVQKTSAGSEDKHYLFNNYSDFWNYKIGEKITLYKSTKASGSRRKREADSSTSEQEETQATFEVVSGALTTSYLHPRCVTKQQKQQKEIKPNLRKEDGGLLEIEAAKKRGYCKPGKGLPAHLLILIGYQGDSIKK